MYTEEIRYEADGLAMRSELYVGEGEGRRPGVLVFPEAFGLSEHARNRARRLAELGFVALACDLHGDASLFQDLPQVLGLIGPLMEDPLHTRARAQGGLDAMLARPEVDSARIAAIGFCFGGTMALELARSGAPIAAAVGFHSGLKTARPEDAKNIRARVLVAIGADDPGIPLEQRTAFEQEMREGNVDWQMHTYGGVVHSFTNKNAGRLGRPDFARYSASADARSWTSMLALFNEVFD